MLRDERKNGRGAPWGSLPRFQVPNGAPFRLAEMLRAVARVAGVGGAVVVVMLRFGASVALAAPPSCATPPAAYTGSDAVVAAVTQLNADEDQNCQAVTARLDQLDSDADTQLAQLHSDTLSIDGHVQAVNATLTGWTASSPLHVALPGGGSGQAVQVTNWPDSVPVHYDAQTSAQVDGLGQSEHGDLWVIVGVIVGTFALAEVLRKVWP